MPEGEEIALERGAHDIVVHGLGLHWANDPIGRMVQARLALKPDGLFLGAAFGGQTLTELRSALAMAESEITGGLSPRIAPMGDIRDLGGLLQRAGFALPVADSLTQKVSYRDIYALMRDLRGIGETNVMTARQKTLSRRALFDRAGEIYAENFPSEDGRILASFEIVFLTGWTPDATQQQPLKPGSAQISLADVLPDRGGKD
ncbi:SAM-dependent methyltransferase [Paracoccaceae bacterium GXU_MW_L88]